MAEFMKLDAKKRKELGKAACRRLRLEGITPATLYGHHVDPVSISISNENLQPVLKTHSRVVDLHFDGQHEIAMLRDVQWNTFGTRIQHLDLLRVNPDERVVVEVPVELRGTSPGAVAGGSVLEQPLKTLHIECLAFHIPDSVVVKIGELQKGGAILVKNLELPQGTRALNPPEAIVVHVVEVAGEVEPLAAEAVATQPEVIGRKEKDEESEEQES